MSTRSDYATQWEDYRRRVRWFLAEWLGGFAVICVLGLLLNKLGLLGFVLPVLAVTWFLFSTMVNSLRESSVWPLQDQ